MRVTYDYLTSIDDYINENLIGDIVPGYFCWQVCSLNYMESTTLTYSISYDCQSTIIPPDPIIQTVNSCPIDWLLILEITIPCLFGAIIVICIIRYYYNHKKQQADFVKLEQQTQLTTV